MRRLGVVLAAVATPVVASVAAVAFVVLHPLPDRSGTTRVPCLDAPVTVVFDEGGFPHVRAFGETDAWKALGWLHAADRSFQMELRRRAAAGRLSEILGRATLEIDEASRRHRILEQARADLEALGADELTMLAAYAEGVNAYLASEPRPLELVALGVVPEPWTPLDSLAFARLLQRDLTDAPGRELDVLKQIEARGIGPAVALLEAEEGKRPEVAPDIAGLFATAHGHAEPGDADPARQGSNAWAVGGDRTASGRPLLANDPHLRAERPGTWYAAHLTTADGLDAAGLTLPGAPGIIIGHNGRVAWGLTMHQPDDSDLFVEKLDTTGERYLDGDTWLPLDRSESTIPVKGESPVTIDVAWTRHGPIVARVKGDPQIVAARASVLDGRPLGLATFLAAPRAADADALLQAWARFAGTAVNVCWATADGRLGLRVAGAIPKRRRGDGRVPVPGWTQAYDWEGMIPAEELPSVAEPPEGLVATANDDWSWSGASVPYPSHAVRPDRVLRARELASGLVSATADDMRRMQNDTYSPFAREVVDVITSLALRDPDAIRARRVLERWDARAESAGPSRLYFAFMHALAAELTHPSGRDGARGRVTWGMLARLLEGTANQSLWDDPATPGVETRGDRVEQALAAAIAVVRTEDGPDPERWAWGRVHALRYEHPLAPALPRALARPLALGPVDLAGEWFCLRVAGFPLNGRGYAVHHVQSARLIFDLGNPDASRIVLPLGQSGHVGDRHESDQLERWSRGEDLPFPFSRAAVDRAAVSTIELRP